MMSQFGMNMDKDTQGKILSDREEKMKKYKPLIQSMTKKEKSNPDLLNSGRKVRIARGAGLKIKDVDSLVSEFRQTKKVMDKIGPMMGMLEGKSGGINPLDTFKNMLPGSGRSLPPSSSPGLGKGFKPKKK